MLTDIHVYGSLSMVNIIHIRKEAGYMVDSQLLREKIEQSGLKLQYIADKSNMTRFSLQKKIENVTEFKATEIMSLSEILGLSVAEREKIFFTANSE